MATMSPIVALILALSMLLTPVAGSAGVQQSEIPPVTLTVDTPDGTLFSAGYTTTTDGLPVAYMSRSDGAFYITSETMVIDQSAVTHVVSRDGALDITPGKAIAVSTEDLLNFIATAGGMLPQPTEDDVWAATYFFGGVMTSISQEAMSIIPRGEGFAIAVDVDRFLADLDKAVPTVLTAYASRLDPVLAKYSTALAGAPITSAQLAELWPDLELGSIRTGLKLSLTVVPTTEGVNILGSVSDFSFVVRVAEGNVQIRFTTPDGTVYPIDFADFAVLAGIFGDLPGQIFSRITTYEQTEARIGYTISIDSAVLSGYLNDGIAATITNNAATMDQLLTKYRPWLALISPQVAGMDAAALSDWFKTDRPIALPRANGYYSQYTTHTAFIIDSEVVGDFGTLTLRSSQQATRYSSYSNGGDPFTLTLTLNDTYDPFIITMSASTPDRYTQHFTVDFSKPVFGLFSTLTYTLNEYFGQELSSITTDTDVFHFIFSAREQYLDAKVGPVSFTMRETANEAWQWNLSMPQFFVDVRQMGDEAISLDSTFFGLDVSANDEASIISGYVRPDEYERYDFGLNVQMSDGYIGTVMNGYLTGEDVNAALAFVNNCLYVTLDGELYSVVPDSETEAILLCHNHGIVATVTGETDDDVTTLYVYEGYAGAQNTAQPMYTITLDSDPDPIALPANVQQTGAQFFLETLGNMLD